MANTFKIEITDDGVVKITSDKFAPTVHATAEKALSTIMSEMGGESKRERTGHTHGHTHSHGDEGEHTHN